MENRQVAGKKIKKQRERLPHARVFLDEPAFITLVCAAAEAYRRECYGVLLGCTYRARCYIHTAYAYQTARRRPKSVELLESRRRVLRQALKAFPRYEFIGEFHSHPGYGSEHGDTSISTEDLVGMRVGELELVVAIHRRSYSMAWHYCTDGSLSGAAGGHLIKMRAYLAEPLKKGGVRAVPVHLRCDYAVRTASSRRLLAEKMDEKSL